MALTVQEVEKCLPSHLRTAVNQGFVDKINNLTADPLVAEEFERNFISYSKVLNEGRYKTEDYLNAVAYVTYKALGHSNQDAFSFTFPDRIRRMVAGGYDAKKISSFVAAYNKGQLVSAIMAQTIIPAYIYHQHKLNDALVTLHEVATDTSALNKDRVAAADSLVRHLQAPEVKQIQLDVSVKESDGVKEMRESLFRLAQDTQKMINGGVSVHSVAEASIIDGTATVVSND